MYEDIEGRFEWGDNRVEIYSKFDDAEELLDEGYEAKGKSALKKIIDEDLQFIDAYNSLGFLEMDAGKYNKALTHFQKAFEIGNKLIPTDFTGRIIWGYHDNRPFLMSMHGLGVCHLKLDDVEKANGIFSKILEYNPNDNQGIRALAIQCNLALKRYSDILTICDKYPDDAMADTLYGRVLALYRTGKEREASEALYEAIKYLPIVATELLKKQHKPLYGDIQGRVTWGEADEAFDYWDRTCKYWVEDPSTLEFVRKVLMSNSSR